MRVNALWISNYSNKYINVLHQYDDIDNIIFKFNPKMLQYLPIFLHNITYTENIKINISYDVCMWNKYL